MQFLMCLFLLATQKPDLQVSVYATAGDIQRHLLTAEGRERAEAALRRLGVTGIFLEGRRGGEYVNPERLREVRAWFEERGFSTAGGIATVPGEAFGERQDTKLGWLNWESPKTRRDVAGYFRENAPVFKSLIVDDFYCTADTSPISEKARGARPWATYRQDLLAGLIEPMILTPARQAHPGVRLIIKYPQWYDRFHMFGYDPARESPLFDAVWAGTEVRNPATQRMGYVQPTQGYMNFRWIASIAGERMRGAWFDHIECTGRNFVDQAWQSVLAGAGEITLFHLGDLMEGHPGHALFQAALPGLQRTASQIRGREVSGISYYKPSGSDPADNMYLMDYLGMIGLPVVPASRYPAGSRVVILGAQAAADADLVTAVESHVKRGATVVVTPALLRKVPRLQQMARVRVTPEPKPVLAVSVLVKDRAIALATPLEIDAGIEAEAPAITAESASGRVPWLTGGKLIVWNVRTFSEQDFRETGEWLLPPKPLGIASIPQELADTVRSRLGFPLSAPVRVAYYIFGGRPCFYNFRDETVRLGLGGRTFELEANGFACQ
ncbi:MAG TPA: hypothetical protein VN442_04115 [Bryobacteraceae bacterium]|nr:hypothetical protein [Bryobacteraceae bacterium]